MSKKEFDWDAFKQDENACVHCKTRQEAEQFVNLMLQHYLINTERADNLLIRYGKHTTNTVYYSDGCYDHIEYANHCGHPIMMFDKYDFGEEVNGYGT